MALRVDDVDLARDRTLVERFQDGDEAAFGELYRRYYDRLQRFCLKRVGDPVEAEELAQEAFARAYRAMPSLAGERRFYPWLSVIAARLCVDTHRRRSRTSPSDDIDLGSVDGGQDDVVASVDVQVLERALGNISDRHREILLLREHEGWSYQRIAEHYDVTMGTVEALLFRARKSLRREFFLLAPEDEVHGRRAWILGVPGLGWAARHAAGLRGRFAHLLEPGLAQAVAGGAAAITIGSIAVLGGTSVGHDAPAALPAGRAVSTATVAPAIGPAVPAAFEGAPQSAVVAPTTSTAPAAASTTVEAPRPASPLPTVPAGGAEISRGPSAPTAGPTTAAPGGVTVVGDTVGYVQEATTRAATGLREGLR
jgi:RNA polymerase sigma-70 factor (ECF subfamily)